MSKERFYQNRPYQGYYGMINPLRSLVHVSCMYVGCIKYMYVSCAPVVYEKNLRKRQNTERITEGEYNAKTGTQKI